MFEFLKKIELNNQMSQFVEELSTINWFSNVGSKLNSKLDYYDVINIDKKQSLEALRSKPNTNEAICLENLIGEAMRRSLSYLYNNRRKDHQNTWNKLSKKNRQVIDFDKIDNISNQFMMDNDIKTDLRLQQVILFHMNELYFKELDDNYPTFFMDIFNIYRKGNIMVGWRGKLPPEAEFLETKISRDNGSVLIW